MPLVISLEAGPYAGTSLGFEEPPQETFALPVDQNGAPGHGLPFGLAVYHRNQEAPATYVFKFIKPVTGQPFLIRFADGPAKGVHGAEQPAQYLDPMQCVTLAGDRAVYRGIGDPTGLAIYERRACDGGWQFYLVRIDESPETVQRLVDEENDRRVTEAINNFYLAPDYDIYSMKPTANHAQVPIELGHRRAHVDEAIAPIIIGLWKMGLDTLGSCQERPLGSDHELKAYVGFPKAKDGKAFHQLLCQAGIDATLDMKELGVARKGADGSIMEELKLPAANVLFSPADVGRVATALGAALN